MSGVEVPLDRLLGRRVRDASGRVVGRIEELCAEIELRERGRDYVVSTYRVGDYGPLTALAGPRVMQGLLRLISGVIGYRRLEIPWAQLDLRDVERPVLRDGSAPRN